MSFDSSFVYYGAGLLIIFQSKNNEGAYNTGLIKGSGLENDIKKCINL